MADVVGSQAARDHVTDVDQERCLRRRPTDEMISGGVVYGMASHSDYNVHVAAGVTTYYVLVALHT